MIVTTANLLMAVFASNIFSIIGASKKAMIPTKTGISQLVIQCLLKIPSPPISIKFGFDIRHFVPLFLEFLTK